MIESSNIVSLINYRSDRIGVSHEMRSPHVLGPQNACHPQALELCLIESGIEYVRHGRSVDTTASGQYSVIQPGLEHSSWTKSKPVKELIIHLPAQRIAEVACEMDLKLSRDWPTSAFATPDELKLLAGSVKLELSRVDKDAGHDLTMDSLTTAIIVVLFRRHFGDDAKPVEQTDPRSGQRLGQVEELLRADPTRSYSLEDLAAVAGLSRYHFLRSFKQRFGMPPHAYLLSLRVERAERLVSDTDLPLTMIAYELGFGSSSRLTESFKKRFGVTPSKWRHRARKAIFGKSK